MTAPMGTYLTISPSEKDYRQAWRINDHYMGVSSGGEATARVVNCTEELVVIPADTIIGQINVLRLRMCGKAKAIPGKVEEAQKQQYSPQQPAETASLMNLMMPDELENIDRYGQLYDFQGRAYCSHRRSNNQETTATVCASKCHPTAQLLGASTLRLCCYSKDDLRNARR